MNHGITTNSLEDAQLGSGIGEFVEEYVFPGGELMHVSTVIREMGRQGLEVWDAECLRPHYARTLWHWVDRLEAQREQARAAGGREEAAHLAASTWPAPRTRSRAAGSRSISCSG